MTIAVIEHYLNYPNTEIIVCDDGSTGKQIELLDSLEERGILVIRQKENSGIGANTNSGLRAAKYSMICQLQDDFLFNKELGVDLYDLGRAIFETDVDFLSLTSVNSRCEKIEVFQFGEIKARKYKNDNIKRKLPKFERPYSDQPHFKTRRFIETIGLYSESLSMVLTEIEYKYKVSQQDTVFICGVDLDIFSHIGETLSFNPYNIFFRRGTSFMRRIIWSLKIRWDAFRRF
jgi:glycosyltransferase involved in cell wall biosynthesis